MKTIADKVIAFNEQLHFHGALPPGFAVMNSFKDNPETIEVMKKFYYRFYNDRKKRRFILGINPSRHGAGITGVPFTDTKRLNAVCGIPMHSAYSHEPSSVFIYEMIEEYGGVETFYSRFYINSPFPLAIVRAANDKWLNANYYDDRNLFKAVKPFMVDSLKHHISIGLETDVGFVLGKKNALFLEEINKEEKLFGKLVVLEHPRYIQQYKSKQKQEYLDKYVTLLMM